MKKLSKILAIIFAVVLFAVLSAGASAAEDKIVIVLDPGHGGNDPGTTVGTRYESEYNYDIALLLKEKLEETGKFQVYLTRGKNEKPVYLIRATVADKYNADMLISLHFNSNPTLDPTLNGVEVLASVLDEWCPTTLASSISSSIAKKCGLTDGGVVRKMDTGDSRGVYYWHDELGWDIPGVKTNRVSDYYSMIAWGTKLGFPSIIVEHAYLSNKSDLAFCDSEGGLEKMAEAEAEAIIKYFTGHVHTYGAETCDRRANCCLEGVYSRKCTTCGHRTDVRRTPKDANVHGWTYDSKTVSCTENGYENKECQISRNLSEKGYDYISIHTESTIYPATGHSFVVEVDTPAGHAVDGLFRQVCTTCGVVEETVRYGDPHIYVTVDSSPVSCTEAGHDTYECTVCRDTYTDEYPAPGHSYESDGEALTCASDGTKEYTCTVCGDAMADNVEIPPHAFEVALDTAPTCTDDGVKLERCSVCGLENRETLPATGHDFSGEGEERVAPTYFARGERVFVCKNDSDHIMVEAIAKKAGGLVMIAAAVAAVAVVALVIALVAVKRKGASAPVKAEADPADTDADVSPAEEKEETEV